MEPDETSPRMQELLDSMRALDARIALENIKYAAHKAAASLRGIEESLASVPEVLPVHTISSRMLISLWCLRRQEPETLATAQAKQAFCDQVATICGDEVATFPQAVEICHKAMEDHASNQALLAYRQRIVQGLKERIASERQWMSECERWASRIEVGLLREQFEEEEQRLEEGILEP